MSRYIRTENGIYKVYAREKCPNGCVITTSGIRIPYNTILREADTKEELCDEFVVVGYYSRPLHFETLLKAKQFVYEKGCQDEEYIEIKGAFWTEWGLKYVAE